MKNKVKTEPLLLGWAHSNSEPNFGDELSAYIVKNLSGREIFYIPVLVGYLQLTMLICKRILKFNFDEAYAFTRILFGHKYLLSTGSILQFYKFGGANVWGSGLISQTSISGKRNKYFAVRGPMTRALLLESGQQVPEVYGDPALTLKKIYNKDVEKMYDVGFIPHIIHFDRFIKKNTFGSNVRVIDLKTDMVEEVIDQIRSCKLILSSSLHGLIVAHTYNIPAIWVKIDDEMLMGDNLKFADYFMSVGIEPYDAAVISLSNIERMKEDLTTKYVTVLHPKPEIVELRADTLINAAPFL